MAVPGELVSFGLQKLWDLLSQEYHQVQGVEDEVTKLKNDLRWLSSFLPDAYAKTRTVETVRVCVADMNEIIFDAEDVFETFQFRKASRIKKLYFRRKLASDIAGICKRISEVIDNMKTFGVQQIVADGRYMKPVHETQRGMRQTFSQEYEGDIVGLEANVEKLVRYLVKNDEIQIVSITGMGGVGKTTLARHVFNHKDVRLHFHGFAWVCVSQEFTRKSVWQAILRNLKPKEEEKHILQMTEDELQLELCGLLKTSKPLIVLDDVWKKSDWDHLTKNIFLHEKGWKVLLTSRTQSVATRLDGTYKNFKAECLSPENSWTLFRNIAFVPIKNASEFEEMEKTGRQMIKYCGGLPLAIKLLGGLLAAKCTLHDWKRVCEDIGTHVFTRPNINDEKDRPMYNILSMSFEELSVSMKHCFLYLAHFPEDYVIHVCELSYQWAADGLFPLPGQSTTLDVANDYIEELVMRNMVIVERHITPSRRDTCQLHDMMREVCVLKAKEENFLQIASTCSSSIVDSQPPRRFTSQNPTTLDVAREINNSKLRSLVVVGYNGSNPKTWMLSKGLCFKRFQLLRRLDLSGAEFEGKKLPSSIGELILLQYLSLEGAKLSHLPKSLRYLKLLMYLNIAVSHEGPIFVPNVLFEMQDLRYLELPYDMRKKKKLELSKLVKLETLKTFSTANCNVGDLHGMARLRILTIRLTEETIENLSASVAGLRHLEFLFILKDKGNPDEDNSAVNEGAQPWVKSLDTNAIMSDRMIERGIVLELANLKLLGFVGIYMPKFPDMQHFPSRLTSLTLSMCGLEEDPMPILEKLLQLKEVFLCSLAFIGSKMVCSAGGFPQLHKLELSGLPQLEEWKVKEDSMPLLHTLDISYCRKLKAIPDGLQLIASLKSLKCRAMGKGWKERLSKGGQDYDKIKHIPSVITGNDDIE